MLGVLPAAQEAEHTAGQRGGTSEHDPTGNLGLCRCDLGKELDMRWSWIIRKAPTARAHVLTGDKERDSERGVCVRMDGGERPSGSCLHGRQEALTLPALHLGLPACRTGREEIP